MTQAWPGTRVPSLRGVGYPAAANRLWRWVDAPADAPVSAFVAGYVSADAAHRSALRAGLSPDGLTTLLTFARRRAFAALRTHRAAEALAAFDALSAIALDRIDWRDVWMVAALAAHAAERTGLDPAEAVIPAAARAEPELGDLLTEVAADPVDLIGECGYREVATPAGRVLVDDDGEAYAPEADLVGVALAVAAALERDRYQVGHVAVAAPDPAVSSSCSASSPRRPRPRTPGCSPRPRPARPGARSNWGCRPAGTARWWWRTRRWPAFHW